MAYEVVMPYHLHMPSYFLETFTEYPYPFTPFSMNIFLGWTNLILKTHPKKIYFGQSYLITNIGVLAWNIIFRAILGLNNRAKIFLL